MMGIEYISSLIFFKIKCKIKEKEANYRHDEYAKHDASSSKTSKTNGAKPS